jgi:hypothetical protein
MPPVFNRTSWGLTDTPSEQNPSGVSIASTSDVQTLQAIGGSDVSNVTVSPKAFLVGMRPLPAAQQRRFLRQQQRQLRAVSQRQVGSCPLSNASPDKGVQFANVSDVVPYGVEMVEAVTPEMIEISKQFSNRVLYCVIDSGERQQGQVQQQQAGYTYRPWPGKGLCS